MPRLLIAPFGFKGTLRATEVARTIAEALRQKFPSGVVEMEGRPEPLTLDVCPLADGGTDTLAVLQFGSPPGRFVQKCLSVMGPLPQQTVEAAYLLAPAENMAVVEAAQAHGIHHQVSVTAESALNTTSYGVGELIRAAIQALKALSPTAAAVEHPPTLVVTLGGSASSDGGMGCLQALGYTFLTANREPLPVPISGADLPRIWHIQPPAEPPLGLVQLQVVVDVQNPLLGKNGAVRVYGPQKGAGPLEVTFLEAGLAYLDERWRALCRLPGLLPGHPGEVFYCANSLASGQGLPWFSQWAGSGAAGGLAYGLLHLPDVRTLSDASKTRDASSSLRLVEAIRSNRIRSGFEWTCAQLQLAQRLRLADGFVTGEGRLDTTSWMGKGLGELLLQAGNRPGWLVCGQADDAVRANLPANVLLSTLQHNLSDFSQPNSTAQHSEGAQAPLHCLVETCFPVAHFFNGS
ncbi:MAG: glycerate kinase [Candidatus Melainabacteria bacterium]|nr:glycerate kinase [Candidatus Melainabacteria bacterium]